MHTADTGIVLVWFGPWRPWIELMLHSFARNRRFDLHVVSPEAPPAYRAPNLHFHRWDREEISRRLGRVTGTAYDLVRPYKLCDFRPAYAHVFPDLLQGYRHWGWCDEDIVWGDLDRFFPAALLGAHDVVATCRACITGQLTLLRNVPAVNALYTRIPDWRERLLDQSTGFALDEVPLNAVAREAEARGELRVLRRQFQTHDVNSPAWNRWADDLARAETGRPHGEFKHGDAIWRDGRLFHAASREEFAFFHFMHWKRRWDLPAIPLPPPEIDEWHLSADGIDFSSSRTPTAATNDYLDAYRAARRRAVRQGRRQRLGGRASAFLNRVRGALHRRLGGIRLT